VLAEKVGQGEVGWYIHPKGENSMTVCGFGCKNPSVGSLHKWSWRTVTSQGLHAMFKCDLLASIA